MADTPTVDVKDIRPHTAEAKTLTLEFRLEVAERELEQWRAEKQDAEHPKIRPMTRLEHAMMDMQRDLGSELSAQKTRIEALEGLLLEQDAKTFGIDPRTGEHVAPWTPDECYDWQMRARRAVVPAALVRFPEEARELLDYPPGSRGAALAGEEKPK